MSIKSMTMMMILMTTMILITTMMLITIIEDNCNVHDDRALTMITAKMFPSILLLLLLKEKAVRTRLHLPQSPPVPSAADVFAEVQQQMATLPTAATVTTSPARPTRL